MLELKAMKVKYILFCLLFIFTFSLNAKDFPQMEPLFAIEDYLGTDTSSLKLTADQLFMIGLKFSECKEDSESFKNCLAMFERIKREVTSSDYKKMNTEEKGRAILKLLYRDYLKSYDFYQTKIDAALETGVYNCVSSAVLYMAAAKSAGLDVRGQRTTAHAFCTVYDENGKKFDVETTNPYGFNPGSKETIENEDNIKRYYVVPKKYYSKREEVNDRIFAGLIAGNLCSYYIADQNYFAALPLGAARYTAASDSRRDFDIIASNFVNLQSGSALDFSENVDWYTSFIDRWGMTDYLQKNMDNLFNNFISMCYNEKNYGLAVSGFERNKQYLTQKMLTKSETSLVDILMTERCEKLTPLNQIEEIENFFKEDMFTSPAQEKRALSYLENSWLIYLGDYMSSSDYEGGYHKSIEAAERLPQSTKIKRMQKTFYDNCIAIIHNKFVKPANAGFFEEARQILMEGLQKFPDDKTLKSDLAALNKMSTAD